MLHKRVFKLKCLHSVHTCRILNIFFFLTLCTVLLAGCKEEGLYSSSSSFATFSLPPSSGPSAHSKIQAPDPLTFTDSLGRGVQLTERPKQVIALSASFAETWLLAGGTLAGTTSDAHTRKEFSLQTNVATIGTIKDPNSEVIISLQPDFVLLSTDIPSHLALSPLLSECGIPHAYFHVEEMRDYLFMLNICTSLTGRKDLYRTHGLDVQQTIDSMLVEKSTGKNSPTYLLLRSYSTKVKAKGGDMMVSRMLGDLGLTNLTELYPSLLEELSMETIIREDPTYIFVIPMGDESSAKATMAQMLETNKAFASLEAVQDGRYHLLPKNLFHYKPNNRWGESYAYLAKLLTN